MLIELYQSIDLDAVHRFVEQRRQEDAKLDFKALGNNATFEREDRKNLAIAISGFANAEGGIIVWGVRAAKDDDGLDAANALAPIENCERALADLRSYTAQGTSPSVDGVECKPVYESDKGEGYLVLYVPAFDGNPCMAMSGEDRYYKRTGDRFVRMEQYEIADMFGKRRRPVLSLWVELSRGGITRGAGSTTFDLSAVIGIQNSGRGLARFPYLELSSKPYQISIYGLDGNRRTGLPRLMTRPVAQTKHAFGGGSDHVVHPNRIVEVTTIEIRVDDPPRKASELTIEYSLGAEDVPVFSGTHILTAQQILDATF